MRERSHEELPDLLAAHEGQEFFEAFRDEHDEPLHHLRRLDLRASHPAT